MLAEKQPKRKLYGGRQQPQAHRLTHVWPALGPRYGHAGSQETGPRAAIRQQSGFQAAKRLPVYGYMRRTRRSMRRIWLRRS